MNLKQFQKSTDGYSGAYRCKYLKIVEPLTQGI